MRKILVSCCLLVLGGAADAAIVGVALGSGPRTDPMPLGPYFVSLLPPDPTGVFASVTAVPGSPPLTGPVAFDKVMSHRKIGSGWATWSPGYPPTWDKSVYYPDVVISVTLTLPADTGAFVLYAEPGPFSPPYVITATAQDGTSVAQAVSGSSGAKGYGFYGTAGSELTSIVVACTTTFVIGEFYGAQIPEPASVGLTCVGLLALARRR